MNDLTHLISSSYKFDPKKNMFIKKYQASNYYSYYVTKDLLDLTFKLKEKNIAYEINDEQNVVLK